VLFTTGARHRPSPELLELFRRHREEGSEVERRVRSGDLLGAIESNGALVEKVMGYDYTELRSRLHDAGALACGISGMGPALVAVGPRDRLAEMANELPVSGTKKFLARLGPARLPPQGDS
jgi:shikimate kinase